MISDVITCDALKGFANEPGTTDKLLWWLLGAHSSERWFQFEFAFQLDRRLKGTTCAALCEQGRRDIVIVNRTGGPLRNNPALAAIELKWLGNWYFHDIDTRAEIAADVAKINAYNFPSVALAVWIISKPSPAYLEYAWIADGVSQTGLTDVAQIDAKMQQCAPGFRQVGPCINCSPTRGMGVLELCAWACHNSIVPNATCDCSTVSQGSSPSTP